MPDRWARSIHHRLVPASRTVDGSEARAMSVFQSTNLGRLRTAASVKGGGGSHLPPPITAAASAEIQEVLTEGKVPEGAANLQSAVPAEVVTAYTAVTAVLTGALNSTNSYLPARWAPLRGRSAFHGHHGPRHVPPSTRRINIRERTIQRRRQAAKGASVRALCGGLVVRYVGPGRPRIGVIRNPQAAGVADHRDSARRCRRTPRHPGLHPLAQASGEKKGRHWATTAATAVGECTAHAATEVVAALPEPPRDGQLTPRPQLP